MTDDFSEEMSDDFSEEMSDDVSEEMTDYSSILPENYTFKRVLGRGGYGIVLECLNKDTNETVAVKIPICFYCYDELKLMRDFKLKELDKCNIVKFINSFTTRDSRPALVFEKLDVDLITYSRKRMHCETIELHEVRSVVQQMATALSSLKEIKVVHADIKLNNIMLVDGDAQPFTLKLIDFGMAFPVSEGIQGELYQIASHRAPEVFLGLPITEAIDMWSLGVIMAMIVLGNVFFSDCSDFGIMCQIVELLGFPEDHLLRAGMCSKNFFVETSGNWRLKTKEEFNRPPASAKWIHSFRKLDDMATLPLENLTKVTADERMELIDLLKAMLQIDPEKRITPSQVLAHPFITRGSLDPNLGSQPPSGACGLPLEESLVHFSRRPECNQLLEEKKESQDERSTSKEVPKVSKFSGSFQHKQLQSRERENRILRCKYEDAMKENEILNLQKQDMHLRIQELENKLQDKVETERLKTEADQHKQLQEKEQENRILRCKYQDAMKENEILTLQKQEMHLQSQELEKKHQDKVESERLKTEAEKKSFLRWGLGLGLGLAGLVGGVYMLCR